MEDQKIKNLAKFKFLATGLFLLMAVGFIITSILLKSQNNTYLLYINAFCEAGMVGALADWFAVTALFKKPLGLNIPHTNLIENSKNEIGENLGDFIQNNFLSPQNIKPYIKNIDPVKFILQWIETPKNKKNIQLEIQNLAINIIDDIDDESLKVFLYSKANHIINNFDISEPAFSALNYLIQNNEHNKLVDKVLPYLKDYVVNNNDFVKEKINEKGGLLGSLFSDRISKGMTNGIGEFIDEILKNPKHKIRLEIELQLLQLVENLQNNSNFNKKLHSLKISFFSTQQIQDFIDESIKNYKKSLITQLQNENSLVNKYIAQYLDQFIHEVKADENLKNRINGWIKQFAFKIITKNTSHVSLLISNTVKNWNGKDLSKKLEIEVGKDLQYIRINGTLIGGLIGIIIHIISTKFI